MDLSHLERRSPAPRRAHALLSSLFAVPLGMTAVDEARADERLQSLPALAAHAHEALAREFDAGVDASIEIARLDARLRLPVCSEPLRAEPLPPRAGHGRRTVEVVCPGLPAWRVRLTAQVAVAADVWTLARAVRRGDRLSADLLEPRRVTLGPRDGHALRVSTEPGGMPTGPAELLGHQFLRGVAAGKTLDPAVLAPPMLVERGRRLRILHGRDGVAISAIGTALADARRGERVSVRNEASGRSLDAVVTARDEVRIR